MKKSSFSRGSILGGIFAVMAGRIFYYLVLSDWHKFNGYGDRMFGSDIFTYIPKLPSATDGALWWCFLLTRAFIIFGAIEIIHGFQAISVKKNGYASDGYITDMHRTVETDSNGGSSTSYYVQFAYQSASEEGLYTTERVSRAVYNALLNKDKVPVLICKNKAIIDIDRVERNEIGMSGNYRPSTMKKETAKAVANASTANSSNTVSTKRKGHNFVINAGAALLAVVVVVGLFACLKPEILPFEIRMKNKASVSAEETPAAITEEATAVVTEEPAAQNTAAKETDAPAVTNAEDEVVDHVEENAGQQEGTSTGEQNIYQQMNDWMNSEEGQATYQQMFDDMNAMFGN